MKFILRILCYVRHRREIIAGGHFPMSPRHESLRHWGFLIDQTKHSFTIFPSSITHSQGATDNVFNRASSASYRLVDMLLATTTADWPRHAVPAVLIPQSLFHSNHLNNPGRFITCLMQVCGGYYLLLYSNRQFRLFIFLRPSR